MKHVLGTVVATAFALIAGSAAAQQPITLKFSNFGPEGASTSRVFKAYVEEWKAKSNGRINLELYHGASMGPMPRHYDLARTGVADFSFYQHGATPGRFPLTELTHMPYLWPEGAKGAVVGAKAMSELYKEYLAREHTDTHNLYVVFNRPSGIFESKQPIKTLADLKNRRYRAPTTTDVAMFKELGAVPIGVPANGMAEALQKGTLDGVVTDAMGVFAFKLGDLVKHYTPMFTAAISFGVTMNKDAYNKLPADLRAIIDHESTPARTVWMVETAWGPLPEVEKYLQDSKIETVRLAAQDDARMRQIADKIIEERIKEVEAKNLPAREFYTKAKAASAKYAKE
jgi:TRAP-type C4-dicarboxylate transport system substrate-binding protein